MVLDNILQYTYIYMTVFPCVNFMYAREMEEGGSDFGERIEREGEGGSDILSGNTENITPTRYLFFYSREFGYCMIYTFVNTLLYFLFKMYIYLISFRRYRILGVDPGAVRMQVTTAAGI